MRESGWVARRVFTASLGAATITHLSPSWTVMIWLGELSFSAERRIVEAGAVLPVSLRMLAEVISEVLLLP